MIDTIKFDAQGLIPAIVQDAESDQILTLAYMNKESLEISLREGYTCFWSRSRQELWRKGDISGNRQQILSITADCDRDALLVKVRSFGSACHTGEISCFHNSLLEQPQSQGFRLQGLYEKILQRKQEMPEASYTTTLFQKGIDQILKKIGEESGEVIIAAKNQRKPEAVWEIADLTYHLLVLMAELEIQPKDILMELAQRQKIDKPVTK
jgi:phosphoribosyl-ATP pyrophosphohydrolase/phosphoribosyl-AMP cyclohydrolase